MSGPTFLLPGSAPWFPDPGTADEDGLVAVGGDLSEERLLLAYECGIFPWYEDDLPPLWWSPDPRAVFELEWLHVSRRLARRLRQGGFSLTWNGAFRHVMSSCGELRDGGTWVIPEMLHAYAHLHERGHAHSLEVWHGRDLVGGVYGVQRGGLFAAESMFHRSRDASKIALVACVRSLFAAGVELFDVQLMNPHLASLGAVDWPRARYLAELARVREKPVDLSAVRPDWRPRE